MTLCKLFRIVFRGFLGLASGGMAMLTAPRAMAEASSPAMRFSTAAPAPKLNFAPRHPTLTKVPVVTDGDRQVARIEMDGSGKRYAYYTYYGNAFAKGAATPGALRIRFDHRMTGAIGQAKLELEFLKPANQGKALAKLGKKVFSIPVSGEWRRSDLFADVPPETGSIRYVFWPEGSVGGTWEISRMQFDYAPDVLAVVPGAPPARKRPSTWKTVAQGDLFYQGDGKPAEAQSAFKLAYDTKNLYVGLIAAEPEMNHLSAKIRKRDGKLWEDDTLEFFLFDPERDLGYQFIVNPLGTRYDGQLRQAQPGDPYKAADWDGEWTAEVFRSKDSWEAVLTIPWSTLGFSGKPDRKLSCNFARERKPVREQSQWNCFLGGFFEVDKYGTLDLTRNTLTRYRKLERIQYDVKRKNPVFREVLSDQNARRQLWFWGRSFLLSYQPPAVRAKYTPETFAPYQRQCLKMFAEAGIAGPSMPWALMKGRSILTPAEVAAAGVRMPYSYSQQTIHSTAIQAGARPVLRAMKFGSERDFTDLAQPEGTASFCRALDQIAEQLKDPTLAKLAAFLHGQDEPTNRVILLYSRNRNPGEKEFLDKLEEKLRAETGFGKYGLYDEFGSAGRDDAFERIAFWRWWNGLFKTSLNTIAAHSRKVLPHYENFIYNRNTCSGIDQLDVALISPEHTVIGTDPYPTSSRMYFGIGRAVYTTGFNVKLLRDLIPENSKAAVFLQGFNYCGGVPTPANAREWASQALKNGADWVLWYTSSCYRENPALFQEALAISRQIADLPRLKLPEHSGTAIFYSDYDRWGLNDRAGHSVYTTYAILGEHVGSWFKFVSRNKLALDNVKLLYVPRMRFTDPELTAKLTDYMRRGGTVVCFDPLFWSFHIDGSPVPERAALSGTELRPRKLDKPFLQYGKKRLPLAAIQHLPQPENNSFQAFDFVKLPADAEVLASYSDGKPAIMARPVGKGRLILSGVQVFGNSEPALAPGSWRDFFADRAREIGEPVDLPIWRFTLPPAEKRIAVPKLP